MVANGILDDDIIVKFDIYRKKYDHTKKHDQIVKTFHPKSFVLALRTWYKIYGLDLHGMQLLGT